MKFASVRGVSIAGICAAVPSRVIDNKDFGRELFGDEIENVVKTTGVEQRRMSTGGVTALDLSVHAAKKILALSPVSPADIGGVVFVTQSPDNAMPNNATLCQHLLGLPQNSAAFDVNVACPGYVYGLWAAGMMTRSLSAPVLLLDGETHSHVVSPLDRATALLFGDAGSATLIVPNESAADWDFGFLTDGEKRDVLIIPGCGSRNLLNENSIKRRETPDGGFRAETDIYMNGMEVFNFVVRNVPGCIQELMQKTGVAQEDVDLLLLHQANLFMMKQIAKKIGFKAAKVPISIDRYGNSGSCTIPLTICSEVKEQISSKKNSVIAAGFGAGLSIACASFELGACQCEGVIVYE